MEMQKDSVSYGDVEGLSELDSLGICCAAFIPFTADHIKRVHMVIYLSRGSLMARTLFIPIQARANKWTHALSNTSGQY